MVPESYNEFSMGDLSFFNSEDSTGKKKWKLKNQTLTGPFLASCPAMSTATLVSTQADELGEDQPMESIDEMEAMEPRCESGPTCQPFPGELSYDALLSELPTAMPVVNASMNESRMKGLKNQRLPHRFSERRTLQATTYFVPNQGKLIMPDPEVSHEEQELMEALDEAATLYQSIPQIQAARPSWSMMYQPKLTAEVLADFNASFPDGLRVPLPCETAQTRHKLKNRSLLTPMTRRYQ
jgi:hypothetical protein